MSRSPRCIRPSVGTAATTEGQGKGAPGRSGATGRGRDPSDETRPQRRRQVVGHAVEQDRSARPAIFAFRSWASDTRNEDMARPWMIRVGSADRRKQARDVGGDRDHLALSPAGLRDECSEALAQVVRNRTDTPGCRSRVESARSARRSPRRSSPGGREIIAARTFRLGPGRRRAPLEVIISVRR